MTIRSYMSHNVLERKAAKRNRKDQLVCGAKLLEALQTSSDVTKYLRLHHPSIERRQQDQKSFKLEILKSKSE